MKRLTIAILALAFSTISYSQELFEQTCYKKSKGECIIPKKEIFKYENGKYLVKKYYKNGTLEFLMDSTISIDDYDGHVQYFNENGTITMDGYYENNIISGTWKIYKDNGTLIRSISYDHIDKPVDTTVINNPGNIHSSYEAYPSFKGGDLNTFRDYIQSQLFYPPIAEEKGIMGRVFVSFTIDNFGNVINAKIEKGVDPSIDKEALRAISSSPKWIPGYQKGKAVKVQFTYPIVFVLQ